jgi:fluoride exporter
MSGAVGTRHGRPRRGDCAARHGAGNHRGLGLNAALPRQQARGGMPRALRGRMAAYIWIAIGGALGSIARYWCSGVIARLIGETFPWGTLLVNVLGSFIIGFFATLTGPDGRIFVGSTARQFVMVGLCGGYTTFSSFSLQTLNLMNDGEWLRAGGNIVGSVMLCLVAVWLGHVLALVINTSKWV